MQGDKLRCAIYCRVARDDEDTPGEAIEQQRQQIMAYAREMGYTETADYIDNGYSGLNADRPGFAKLNADIEAGRVDVVIAKDPSRFWRDFAHSGQWYSHMDKKGVTVLCPDTPGFQQDMRELYSDTTKLFKRKKKESTDGTQYARRPRNPKAAEKAANFTAILNCCKISRNGAADRI